MKRYGFLCLLFFTLLLPFSAAAAHRALLIGCDSFVSRPPTDPSSENNLRIMEELLNSCDPAPERLDARLNHLTGSEDLKAALEDVFADSTEDDVCWIYFSTHGEYSESGVLSLVLSDGVTEGRVTAEELSALLKNIPGEKRLILDACHSGAAVGKGMDPLARNPFTGSGCQVLCSSGAAEESWFWSGSAGSGAGYFTGTMALVAGSDGGYTADEDRDGIITLGELQRCLRELHGLSTVHCYPEESRAAFFRYDPERNVSRRPHGILTAVSFQESVLTPAAPAVNFFFTLPDAMRTAYQIIYLQDGMWDFQNCEILRDAPDTNDTWPATGALEPGCHERSVSLPLTEDSGSGYALIQILGLHRGILTPLVSHPLCVPPPSGDPDLRFEGDAVFCPASGEEYCFVVRHAFPCELTVTVENENGETVRRLCTRQSTRPERIQPEGSFFCWSGQDANGSTLPPGNYRILISAYVGKEEYTILSPSLVLTEQQP